MQVFTMRDRFCLDHCFWGGSDGGSGQFTDLLGISDRCEHAQWRVSVGLLPSCWLVCRAMRLA